jgi:hypothetical protein
MFALFLLAWRALHAETLRKLGQEATGGLLWDSVTMNSAQFTNRFPAAAGNSSRGPGWYGSACSVSTIRITQEDIENSGRRLKCENRLIGRLSSSTGSVPSATKFDYNDIVPDHKNPKGMGGAWRDDHTDNPSDALVVQRRKRINPNGRLTADHPTSGRDFLSTHFDINCLPEG